MSQAKRVRCIICGREEVLPAGKTLRVIDWYSPDGDSLDRCVCKEHIAGFISGELKPPEKTAVEKPSDVNLGPSKSWPVKRR